MSIAASVFPPRPASAGCNIIPGVVRSFRGTTGTLDRPFAGPGDRIEIGLDMACDASTFAAESGNLAITVVFTATSDAPRHVVVLAPSCTEVDLGSCRGPNIATVRCIDRGEPSPVDLLDERRLRFVFPDTDTDLAPPGDAVSLSGPATIAVTRASDPLPCDLAAAPCSSRTGMLACVDRLFAMDGTCGTEADSTFGHFTALPTPNNYKRICTEPRTVCDGNVDEIRFAVDADGNMLIPVDWRGVLVRRDRVPVARLLRGTSNVEAFAGTGRPIRIPGNAFLASYSPEGGRLPPLFEPQSDSAAADTVSLFGSSDAAYTVLRIARRSNRYLECASGAHDGLPCLEAADCPAGACVPSTCRNGSNAGRACTNDLDCPDGECGPALFDFRSRLFAGVGPVRLRATHCLGGPNEGGACATAADCPGGGCGAFEVAALDPVPLDGLNQTDDLFAFVASEAIENAHLNDDSDDTDDVVVLADRRTGEKHFIGSGNAPGRAVVRIHQPPFTFPALAAEANIVAFLEPEPLEGRCTDETGCDKNADGDAFDTLLRVYGLNGQEITSRLQIATDADPVINHRSVVVSDGVVFFRARAADGAPQAITRVSVSSTGVHANAASQRPTLSADGRSVAFESAASNLGGAAAVLNTFVHDRVTGTTVPLSVAHPEIPADAPAQHPFLSGDGRFAALSARDIHGHWQVFVLDRDADGNGVHDEPGGISNLLVSTGLNGIGSGDSLFPTLSPAGRFVSFFSNAHALFDIAFDPRFPPSVVWTLDRDRDGNGTHDEPGGTAGTPALEYDGSVAGSAMQDRPLISADGRFLAWSTAERSTVRDDRNEFCLIFREGSLSTNCPDVALQDRIGATTERASIGNVGEEGNGGSFLSGLSSDGRYTAFVSYASNLVDGDTNGVADVFVHDRVSETTQRVSRASNGAEANGTSATGVLAMSANGRYVAFSSSASNLVPGDHNDVCDVNGDDAASENCADVFVHDVLTGLTHRASVAPGGHDANALSRAPALSADGLVIAFESTASNLVQDEPDALCDSDGDGTASERCTAIFVSAVAPDRSGSVLYALDTRDGTHPPAAVAPASLVTVAGRNAAMLTSEASVGTDLNRDGDQRDEIVQLYLGASGAVINLERAATAVALSDAWVGALISEHADGDRDLNGDGDHEDLVVAVRPATREGTWIDLHTAADAIDVVGPSVAFITPEAGEGADLNGDADMADRVVRTFDASTSELIESGQAAEEFVLGPTLLAFRTAERSQAGQVLNDDGDADDFVLQIFDLRNRRLINTAQAVTPCRLEACDPRLPYRVFTDTVKFLTFEQDQGRSLNDDDDTTDLLLQVFNVSVAPPPGTGAAAGAAEGMRYTHVVGGAVHAGAVTTVGAVNAGICSVTGKPCTAAADCGGGSCFVPPGHCIHDIGTPCSTVSESGSCAPEDGCCAVGAFCVPTGDGVMGSCHRAAGACNSDAECPAGDRCQDAGLNIQRLVGPLAQNGAGTQVFVSSGEDDELILATAHDSDRDEIADAFDNCPSVANVDQVDTNGDGVGDACVRRPDGPSADGCAIADGARPSWSWCLLTLPFLLCLARRVRL